MFFTLSATYPVAAGLGAGGICLERDTNGRVTEFDFLTRQPRAGGAYAIPGAVRGFHEMQTLYGALPWQRTVGPGEAYAATGFAISQALATRLADSQNVVRLDASLAAEFLDESGQPRAAGTEARNVPLSQAMTQIRLNGADGFYKGATAQRIVAWSAAQGGAITADELAATAAKQTAPRQRRTVENRQRTRATEKAAAVKPDEHRPAFAGITRAGPDIQKQAVFVLRFAPEIAERIRRPVLLRARWPEAPRIAPAGPGLGRLRRPPTQRPDRRLRVGNSLEAAHRAVGA